jgi:hypothetical protein
LHSETVLEDSKMITKKIFHRFEEIIMEIKDK